MTAIDGLGWIATAVVVLSYFSSRQERLRILQMVGAVLWAAYGLWIGASPVVVANLLVLSAAGVTTWRARVRLHSADLPTTMQPAETGREP